MERLWRELIDCGIKSVGTEDKKKAEDLLYNEFKSISDSAYKMEFTFEGWGVTGPAYLSMTAPQQKDINTWIFLGSGNGEFEGDIRYIGKNVVWNMYRWDRYGVFKDDKIVAYISGRPEGRLISQTLIEGSSELPHFIVDENDNRMLKQMLDSGQTITVKGEAMTYVDKEMRGCNIVLPLRAEQKSEKKIILCAHYDTMYNTKGAFDNASGSVMITEIARMLAKQPLKQDIDIVLMDAEECRLEGAKYYASQVNPDEIDYLVNVDGAGRGDVLEIWCGYEAFERELIEYLQTDDTFVQKVYINPPPPGSDHVPFYEMGINCCELTVNDQDLLHMPEDDYQEGVLRNMERMLPLVLKVLDMHQE